MNLDSYQVNIMPWVYKGVHGRNETFYRITISINGEEFSCMETSVDIPPHMAEIEVLNKMTQKILHDLREKNEQDISNR